MKHTKNNNLSLVTTPVRMKRLRTILSALMTFVMLLTLATAVFAEDTDAVGDDPVVAVNKLADWLLSLFASIGVIVFIVGVVQFIMSFSGHDTSQRIQGAIILAMGLVFFSLRWFINFLAPGVL